MPNTHCVVMGLGTRQAFSSDSTSPMVIVLCSIIIIILFFV